MSVSKAIPCTIEALGCAWSGFRIETSDDLPDLVGLPFGIIVRYFYLRRTIGSHGADGWLNDYLFYEDDHWDKGLDLNG